MNATKNTNPDFLDILFDGRNKNYGAYEHRVTYDKRVRNAIIGTASIALVIIGGYLVGTNVRAAAPPTPEVVKPLVMTDIPMEKEPEFIPPPPPKETLPPPPVKSTIAYTAFKVVDKDVPEEEAPPKMDDIKDNAISTKTEAGDPDGIDPGLDPGNGTGKDILVPPPAPKVDETPRTFVEIMPEFPGGEEAMNKFLKNNIRYPMVASENGIQGIVSVTFVVSRTGEISDFKILSLKKGGGLEEEALRVVRKMPKWKPGKQNGQAVPVQFNLPINFRLDSNY